MERTFECKYRCGGGATVGSPPNVMMRNKDQRAIINRLPKERLRSQTKAKGSGGVGQVGLLRTQASRGGWFMGGGG